MEIARRLPAFKVGLLAAGVGRLLCVLSQPVHEEVGVALPTWPSVTSLFSGENNNPLLSMFGELLLEMCVSQWQEGGNLLGLFYLQWIPASFGILLWVKWLLLVKLIKICHRTCCWAHRCRNCVAPFWEGVDVALGFEVENISPEKSELFCHCCVQIMPSWAQTGQEWIHQEETLWKPCCGICQGN